MHRTHRIQTLSRTATLALLTTVGVASAQTQASWRLEPTPTRPTPFVGTGGPGGNFDWQIGDDSSVSVVTLVLDTTFTVITDVTQTQTENVINGVVDVHDMTIKPNGKLIVQGPNPCTILASGRVVINGQLVVRGTNNPGVTNFDSTNLRDPGAPGQAGGGNGGTGNWSITASTPFGQSGYGAFNSPNGGGGGGETGYAPGDENTRRGAGGGGGAFGADVTFIATSPVPGYACPDQSSIGLDVERGFDGPLGGNGALHPGTPPVGGAKGPRPFFDGDPNNDFWGTLVTPSGQMIQGELTQAWAGAGGGAGGNACDTNHFPTTPFSPTGDEKGAGGGGGGGSLSVFARGDIVIGRAATSQGFAGFGVIDASGGTGGGGENTNSLNHVGAGSGGGSGGHVILQSGGNIDFTTCTSASLPPGGIYAFGGQGGEGFLPQSQTGGGGALGGFVTSPYFDALPRGAYPSNSANTPCAMRTGIPPGAPANTVVYTSTNTLGDPTVNLPDVSHIIIGAGGDGGPGIIQLHVADLSNIKPPTGVGQNFYKILKPPPVGTDLTTINLAPQGHWGHLLPFAGILGGAPDGESSEPATPESKLELFRVPFRF